MSGFRRPPSPPVATGRSGCSSNVAPPTPGPAVGDLYPGTTNTEFYVVQVQSEGTGLAIKFDYTGPVIPAFTVGTSSGVFASQMCVRLRADSPA